MSALPAEDLPADQLSDDDHTPLVGGQPDLTPVVTTGTTMPSEAPSQWVSALLSMQSDSLDQLEATRIATENRVRDLRQVRGADDSAEIARMEALVEAIRALEHGVELELKRALRLHPLGAWVKQTVGIGEKQGARLLAALGDPAWNYAEDRPRRGPAELWAYVGLHVLHPRGHELCDAQVGPASRMDPSHLTDQTGCVDHTLPVGGVAPRRLRGQKANWNAAAKMRAFLVAESCIKQMASPYRPVYDAGRAKYADAVHDHACARCGPKGQPAQPGSLLSAGHQHARALRLVMKAILRDLWREARQVQ